MSLILNLIYFKVDILCKTNLVHKSLSRHRTKSIFNFYESSIDTNGPHLGNFEDTCIFRDLRKSSFLFGSVHSVFTHMPNSCFSFFKLKIRPRSTPLFPKRFIFDFIIPDSRSFNRDPSSVLTASQSRTFVLCWFTRIGGQYTVFPLNFSNYLGRFRRCLASFALSG